MSIDRFLDRVPSKGYNCLDFTREVWLSLYGEDIYTKLRGILKDFGHCDSAVIRRGFTRLKEPSDPCFVVMQRFKLTPHVGIYLNRRVLHLHVTGVEYQPLCVARGVFQTIRYYR